jgi:hypothetical protein
MNVKELIIARAPNNNAWYGYLMEPGRGPLNDTPSEDIVRAITFPEVIAHMRDRIVEAEYTCERTIVFVGKVDKDTHPDFYTTPRKLYPGMQEIDNLWDDSELAIIRLSYES